MISRDKILAAVAANQPELVALPDIESFKKATGGLTEKFIATLTGIGGKVIRIKKLAEVDAYINETLTLNQRVVSTLTGLNDRVELINNSEASPHSFSDVEIGVLSAHLGVAENGAVWLKDDLVNYRVLPFICQNLCVVLPIQNIVPTMHEAYDMIGQEKYSYGTFIAGPSKTADIEQSLVLGAHGSRTMTIFLIDTSEV